MYDKRGILLLIEGHKEKARGDKLGFANTLDTDRSQVNLDIVDLIREKDLNCTFIEALQNKSWLDDETSP